MKIRENYIKLKTSKRIMDRQSMMITCLNVLRGNIKKGVSDQEIDPLLKSHIKLDYWSEEKFMQDENDKRCIHLFAIYESKDEHNYRTLHFMNIKDNPVSIITA